MKKTLFTFVIPAYNGSPFIDESIHSLINERIMETNIHLFYEIIVINDGSTDNTVSKAEKLAKKWNKKTRENFIRVIDKPNGQYGSVINRGIQESNGVYFKVLDVDDTFHLTSLIELVQVTHGLKKKPDVIFTDYTFEKIGSNEKHLQTLRNSFDPYELFEIQELKWPKDLITMHSVIYRLDLLKAINYKQIEGVYYSDSQYSLIPLEYANTVYYMDIPLYRYYIGRGEQSINMKVMVKNRLHQLKVLERIWTEVNFKFDKSKNLHKYYRTVMKQMLQWQTLLVTYDKSIKGKALYMRRLLKNAKQLQPKEYKKITNTLLFHLIRITRGHGVTTIMKVGIKIYAKFKKNILAEWD